MTISSDLIWPRGWLIQWLNDNTNKPGSCSLFALLSSMLVYPHASSSKGPKMASVIPGKKC